MINLPERPRRLFERFLTLPYWLRLALAGIVAVLAGAAVF